MIGEADLITQAEAAALLGLTTPAVAYIANVRRLLTRHRRKNGPLYSLVEVQALRDRRAGQKKAGRPSGADLLRRRLKRGFLHPSGSLPPECQVVRPDDENMKMKPWVDPCFYRQPQSGGMPVTLWAQNPPDVARRLLAKDGIQYIQLIGSRDGLQFSLGYRDEFGGEYSDKAVLIELEGMYSSVYGCSGVALWFIIREPRVPDGEVDDHVETTSDMVDAVGERVKTQSARRDGCGESSPLKIWASQLAVARTTGRRSWKMDPLLSRC